MRSVLLAGIIGGLVVAGFIGGFLALDKTTLHVYEESNNGRANANATPSFSSTDAGNLTENAIASGTLPIPSKTHFAKCTKADYRSGNHKWIVTCELREVSGATPIAVREFVFDDATGQVTSGAAVAPAPGTQ
jgi:hypothetical protein